MDIDYIVRRRKDIRKVHTAAEPLPPVKLVLGFGLNDSAQLSFGNFERPTKCIDNVDLDRVFGPRSTHIVKIVCGGYHTMILMDDGTVYGVGENGLGQLGTGDTTQFFKPRRVEGLPLNDPIMDVSCGQNNSYFITCNGEVWACGDGVLGIDDNAEHLTPERIDPEKFNLQKIIAVSRGGSHTAFLTEDDNVFMCGNNTNLQFGFPTQVKLSTKPIHMNQIPNRIVVEQIACGQNHTVFLSCAGTAYTAGSNIRGQLGIGKRSRMEGFSKVSGLEFKEVSQIACGQTHTVFLTYENQVYVCGSNSSGELGIDSGDFEDRVTPTKLHHYQLDKVKMIACGGWNTVFVSTRNDIMVCGCNEEGQVGIKQLSNGPFHSKNGVVPLPQQLLHEKFYRKWHVVHAACGMRHMLLYCTDEPEIVTPHFFNLPQSRQEGQYADVLFVQRQ